MDIHFQKECMLDQMRHIKVKIVKFQKKVETEYRGSFGCLPIRIIATRWQ